MSEKTKKILIIVLFILIILILVFLIYYVFFKKPIVEEIEPVVITPEAEIQVKLPVTKNSWEKMTIRERLDQGLPTLEWPSDAPEEITEPIKVVIPEIDEIAQGGKTWITPVSSDPVKGATISADGKNSIYYDINSGHFYQTDNLGNKQLLTDQVFYNIENINWSPNKDKAIIEYPDGFKVVYDFNKKEQYTLPKNWQDFFWNKAGTQIVFKSTSQYPENNWLAVANPDASQSKPIEHLGENADKVTISWSPNNQVIAFSATGDPRGTWEQEILLIGQNQENFRSLIIDGRGFEPKWNPKGDQIVYSVYSSETGYQPRLYLVKAQGDEIGNKKIDLGLATWAHKCVFSQQNDFLYCAVPQELPEGAGLVLELAEDSRDDFYKINSLTGEISFLAEGAVGGYNVEDIYLSGEEDYLYFTDKNANKLRYIRLK